MITLGNLTGFCRRYVRDGCTGKKAFDTYSQARKEIENLIRKNAHRPSLGVLGAYDCKHCGKIHIGHTLVAHQ